MADGSGDDNINNNNNRLVILSATPLVPQSAMTSDTPV